MKIPALGVEYVTFTATADFALDGALEVHLRTATDYPPSTASWSAASWSAPEVVEGSVRTRSFDVLLAGSAVDPVPGGALVLNAGLNYVWVRLTDNPEVIIRSAGRIEAL